MSIDVKHIEAVAVVTLSAPESLNALVVEDLMSLRDNLRKLQDDPSVRCIVLTGEGTKAFCTGANLKGTSPPTTPFAGGMFLGKNAEAKLQGYTRLADWSDLELWKPVIAAINGFCLGGGLELALQCDIRLASQTASFALPEVKIGSIPAVGGVQLLMRTISASHAMKLALTGDRIDADTALRIGLVSDVVPAEELMREALAIAQRIASNGPLGVQAVKKLALETSHMPPKDFIAQTISMWGILRDTKDRTEGRTAFTEKRPPVFRGQ